MKLYFPEFDDEHCYPLEHHIEKAKEDSQKDIVLFEATKYKETEYVFCKEFFEWGEKDGCGKICDKYAPRNGKSGICKHWSNVAYAQGEKVIYNIETKQFQL